MYEEEFEHVETREDLEETAQKFIEELDLEHLLDRLEGRNGGLRPSKPNAQNDTGLEKYIWRIARFHSGADPSMPVMADTDLNHWLQNESGIDVSEIEEEGFRDSMRINRQAKGYKQIVGISHVVSKLMVANLKGDPNGGLKRWKKAIWG